MRVAGASGTVFRLQGGSLVEGEGAPFDQVVYTYSIVDGIRDGYLVPAFSVGATETIDVSKLRTRQGEFTAESSDAQMIGQIDNHIAQMVHHGADRRAWLVFEASSKSAKAMAQRMNEWRIPTGLVLGETKAAERTATVEAFRNGRLRALVNINALSIGFDVPQVDMLVMRRPTKSVGLYIQQIGRGLRTIGGNIEASKAAGKSDCIVLDFASLIPTHGPLDFIRAKETKAKLVSCESCGKRNASAAAKCWSCGATMLKNCPACLESVPKYMLDCPHCGFDMRREETAGERAAKLLETPSGAALIASYKTGTERQGGWIPVRRAWQAEGAAIIATNEGQWPLEAGLAPYAQDARWIRLDGDAVGALLLPNGASRSNAWQVNADGSKIIVPLPGLVVA